MRRASLTMTVLACALAVLAAGCTKAQPPRSFVQPNVLRKGDFNGTWYYMTTVIDAPPTNGAVYQGQYGGLQKVKWVISEDTLFAVRAYQFIINQEQAKEGVHGNVDGSEEYQGQPLAAFRIQSHFDIIRDYNPTTGEETNRIIESQERPWNERQYFRVDWTRNMAPDFEGIGLSFTFDGVEMSDVGYYVSDPTSPDRLHVERADSKDKDLGFGENEMIYLDITNQMIATPVSQEFVIDEAGNTMKLPSCFMYYGTEDCAAQKFKLRHAFSKKPTATTYEKREWNGIDQQLFGFFTTDMRKVWDKQYGLQYTNGRRYANRFNLFKQSCRTPGTSCEAPHRVRDILNDASWLTKYTDADLQRLGQLPAGARLTGTHLSETAAIAAGLIRATDDDGNPVEIADSEYLYVGTDRSEANGGVDSNWIPYAEREQATIPYYANAEMPDKIWDWSKEIIRQWNDIFKVTVSDLTGKPVSALKDVFVWCHNPVRDGDAEACFQHVKPALNADGTKQLDANGKEILLVREGDPRRAQILWYEQYQAGGPLGLGPAMADPETGESISAKANIYGGAVNTYSASSRDLIGLINGDIPVNTFINGIQGDAWVKQGRSGQGYGAAPKGFSEQEISDMASNMDFSWAATGRASRIDRSDAKKFKDSLMSNLFRYADNSLISQGNPDARQAMLDKIRGSALEARLMTPELKASMGLDPRKDFASLNGSMKSVFSPLNLHRISEMRQNSINRLASLGICFDAEPSLEAFYDVMTNEADHYKGKDAQEIYEDIRRRVYIGVTLHEVGHNMGLRHNFRATFDAMNYFPGYWKARFAAAEALHPADVTAVGKPKLYARSNPKGAIQPQETAQDEHGLSSLSYTYSSIMDYGAAWNTDLAGLGKYDAAAIKYGYANYVEVFTESRQLDSPADAVQVGRLASLQTFFDAYGFPSALDVNSRSFGAVNYYSIPDMFLGDRADGLEKRKDISAYKVSARAYRYSGSGVNVSGTVKAALVDGKLLPEVPYFFCSDEFVGNLTCQRFDFGADAYEQGMDIITRYKRWYLLRNFRQNSTTFHSSPGYLSRTKSRYFDILREQLTWYTLLRANYTDYFISNGQSSALPILAQFFANDQDGWGSFTAAVNEGFKLFGEVLTSPEAGEFFTLDPAGRTQLYTQVGDETTGVDDANTLHVDITDGRYLQQTWNFNGCGYYWGDECQSRIGYFTDKVAALDILGESQAYFTGRDTSTDVRKYAIGYFLTFKQQIVDKLGALLAEDFRALAPEYMGPGLTLNRMDWSRASVPNDNAGTHKLLDPGVGFSLQMWTGVMALSGFASTFDQTFTDNSRLFVVGNGEAPVQDSSLVNADGSAGALASRDPAQLIGNGGTKEWFVFTDPLSGKTYAARSTAKVAVSGRQVRTDIGVRMLERARSLDALTRVPGNTNAANNYLKYQQNLAMMRSLHAAFGYGPYSSDN